MKDFFQTADWKSEKHVPVIEFPEGTQKGKPLAFKVSIGKEIPHPNTTEHHIDWIEVIFHPENEKFPYQIGKFEFTAHGASVEGPDTSTIYSHPEVSGVMKTQKKGTIYALAYCNIHGLWMNSAPVNLE